MRGPVPSLRSPDIDMRFIHLYLIGYFVLVVGAGLALWQAGVLARVGDLGRHRRPDRRRPRHHARRYLGAVRPRLRANKPRGRVTRSRLCLRPTRTCSRLARLWFC